MALSQSAVSELLEAFRAGEGVDLVRESVRLVLQELIEAEATEVIGAGRYERSRRAQHRAQRLPAAGADHQGRRCRAADPEAAQGLVLPGRSWSRAAHRPGAVRGGDGGLRARRLDPRVDDLVEAMGVDAGISKSEVSRICAGLDEEVGAFRTRTAGRTPSSPTSTWTPPTCTCATAASPGGLQGGRGRHRGHRRRPPGDPRTRRRRQRGRGVLARRS